MADRNRQSVNGYLMPFLTLPMPAVIYQPMGSVLVRSQVNQGKLIRDWTKP